MSISRRGFIAGASLALAGCVTREQPGPDLSAPLVDPFYASMYAAIDTEPYPVPAIDLAEVRPEFLRREVAYRTSEPPGTIVVDPVARYAYLVRENGRALRYGVGVGQEEAFNFRGAATIARKAEWPGWRPTPDMIRRDPDRYGPVRDGLPGGPGNPLGPRALYLYRDGRDTYYRLHGTVEPWSIGTMVSSGCIRLLNQDIIDLYRRVPIGSRVVVLPARPAAA
ncbi:L,D-transpeptidase [Aquabacter spiritensis]|uniref:Lipoprotein-anchoring transpeptidase ErfK/SrfK n=1 Tax=Aquabacter spiritensis TaxID=933073 RepID=A0A4R3LJS1_9HYPH|nr:L,D-transpeptidase [Aquabacter spiritensis]TCT00512.1 lipoprotein-anchoring transpeptidase ErfK/SrfK [Aquabacter spiritensis]